MISSKNILAFICAISPAFCYGVSSNHGSPRTPSPSKNQSPPSIKKRRATTLNLGNFIEIIQVEPLPELPRFRDRFELNMIDHEGDLPPHTQKCWSQEDLNTPDGLAKALLLLAEAYHYNLEQNVNHTEAGTFPTDIKKIEFVSQQALINLLRNTSTTSSSNAPDEITHKNNRMTLFQWLKKLKKTQPAAIETALLEQAGLSNAFSGTRKEHKNLIVRLLGTL